MKTRILVLFSIFVALWALLITRAVRLQLLPDERLENLKRRQFETSLEIRTRRGAILDRDGSELAASVPSFSLFADPKLLQKPSAVAHRLAKKLGIPYAQLSKRLRDHERRFVWIKRQLDQETRDEIKKWQDPGLGFIEEPKRVYPNGSLLSQVLGFVGSDGRGLEGLELQFNKDLQGHIKQVILPRDARGRPLLQDGRALTEVPDGSDLELTIDHEVQFKLERELQEVVQKYEADGAVGIAMDAQTSEILGMANVPTVDLNEASHASMAARRDRLVSDAFEPGSVMKSFVIAGALRDGVIKPGTRYFCENGRMKIGSHWIKEAEAKEQHKWLDVTEILGYSSNVGAAKIAFDLGDEHLMRVLSDFGFGAKTGIELPGEARGIVNPLPWREIKLATVAFGQGIAVTPMQLAMAYTAIANGGMLRRPLLVRAIRPHDRSDTAEFQAEDLRRVLTPAQAATMRLMLAAATEDKYTGFSARIPGYFVGGKTGTAQKVDPERRGYMKNAYISSFAGFVPATNPKYVIYIAVDNPRKAYYGSQVAGPVFAHLAQYLVRRAGLSPMQISEQNVIPSRVPAERTALQTRALRELHEQTALESAGDGFPDLTGLSLREALNRLHDQNAQIDVRGHGVVARTIPLKGAPRMPHERVTLILEQPH